MLEKLSPRLAFPTLRPTTRDSQAAFPFAAESGFGAHGTYIGTDTHGASFCWDPFIAYEQGYREGPNALVMGEFGQGKSALLKSYAFRQLCFNRIVITVDAKHEYDRLAQSCGVQPIALEPGGDITLNPLDPRGNAQDQVSLLCAITEALLRRELSATEREGLRVCLQEITARRGEITIPTLVEALLKPTQQMADRAAAALDLYTREMREPALALRRLCPGGDLAGMFDGPTSPGIDFSGQLVVLDISSLLSRSHQGFAVLLACAVAWIQALIDDLVRAGDPRQVIVIADEAWRALSEIGVGEWLQSSFKLGRSYGVQNIVVIHRLSDLRAVGSEGSREVRLAEGLLADAPTRIIYSMPPNEIAEAKELLDLTDTEAELVGSIGVGEALWKIHGRSLLVNHRLSQIEREIVDTDRRMLG
jgi:type IV secretory pathway VirB4 component